MSRLEGLEHRLLGRCGCTSYQLDQFVTGADRRVVERELDRRTMARCALGDRRAEGRDPVGKVARSALAELLEGDLCLAVEVGVIAPDQLDDDRLFGLEVVIQAPGLDAACLSDLLECRSKSRGGEHVGCGVENLVPTTGIQGFHRIGRFRTGSAVRRAHPGTCSVIPLRARSRRSLVETTRHCDPRRFLPLRPCRGGYRGHLT